jgi:hypothetical protein
MRMRLTFITLAERRVDGGVNGGKLLRRYGLVLNDGELMSHHASRFDVSGSGHRHASSYEGVVRREN